MTTADDRDAALRVGDELWEELQRLADAHLDTPFREGAGLTGHDLYAHFARWQAVTLRDLARILAGRRPVPPVADDNVLNDRWMAEDRALSTDIARARCLETRTNLREQLANLTDAQYDQFGRICAADINGEHYLEHLRPPAAPPSGAG